MKKDELVKALLEVSGALRKLELVGDKLLKVGSIKHRIMGQEVGDLAFQADLKVNQIIIALNEGEIDDAPKTNP